MIERLCNDPTIIVAGHRGYKSAYPENTLLAFQQALELGVGMLEFDLRMSKDHVVMVFHDETLERTTNGSGKLRDFNLAELKQMDAGGWFSPCFEGLKIPTFDELCELLKPYPEILLNVEIKKGADAREIVDKAVAMLTDYGYLSRCVFTCFDGDIIAYMHDRYKLKTQGFPAECMSNFVFGEGGTYSKMWAIGISVALMTPKLVEEFQDMGLLTWCYCPDTDKEVYYSLGCGATLMTCNNPNPALRILQFAAQ
ncbi:glycerophosphodiester phosphodiesterase [Paenibacillus sp. LMG 31460]|uniref:Glycerophosphodiester phosphodiesterase n=1 Tax=Paenibacillus germinis TaxID=2654979 RepID=A0ABX1Z7G3_9BACL|nr:glycerophosphodiester phosphodiesterase family protein [Paenibacillus germinis]NOU87886.1 glycerophosphodiester phosphodiesterase [Paenibacillus germinis]